jgi:ComF family protein
MSPGLSRAGGALLAAAAGRVRPLLGHALEFALPQRCPACGAEARAERVLCERCLARVPRLHTPICARCLADGRDPSACARHAGHRVFAPWLFDDHAAAVVHALKYGARPALARPLGAEMAAAVGGLWRRSDLVLEVPLHPARERERGYNQAALLADALADTLGVPRLPRSLARSRATRPQAHLDAGARRANVAGAFAVVRPNWLAGRRVLVVDDVMTTGATLEACLDALADAGAKAAGVTLAWTP